MSGVCESEALDCMQTIVEFFLEMGPKTNEQLQ